jgi:hypothetical protein
VVARTDDPNVLRADENVAFAGDDDEEADTVLISLAHDLGPGREDALADLERHRAERLEGNAVEQRQAGERLESPRLGRPAFGDELADAGFEGVPGASHARHLSCNEQLVASGILLAADALVRHVAGDNRLRERERHRSPVKRSALKMPPPTGVSRTGHVIQHSRDLRHA